MAELRDINTLIEWDKNHDLRGISKTGVELLKKNLEFGQHSTLLIKPDGTVLGGNHRLKVMREMGYTEVECTVLTFGQDDQGYYPIFNGREYKKPDGTRPKYFPTVEVLEIECALSHNNNPAFYQKDGLLNLIGNFPEINVAQHEVSFNQPENLGQWVEKVKLGEQDKQAKPVTCPACNHVFTIEK